MTFSGLVCAESNFQLEIFFLNQKSNSHKIQEHGENAPRITKKIKAQKAYGGFELEEKIEPHAFLSFSPFHLSLFLSSPLLFFYKPFLLFFFNFEP